MSGIPYSAKKVKNLLKHIKLTNILIKDGAGTLRSHSMKSLAKYFFKNVAQFNFQKLLEKLNLKNNSSSTLFILTQFKKHANIHFLQFISELRIKIIKKYPT